MFLFFFSQYKVRSEIAFFFFPQAVNCLLYGQCVPGRVGVQLQHQPENVLKRLKTSEVEMITFLLRN
jgi:hypothetical protein